MTPDQVATVKDKLYANWIISRLVAYGELPKARTRLCEICGVRQAEDWHHPSYHSPLEVIAVCSQCHGHADHARRADELG
jgi:hypothetical protein